MDMDKLVSLCKRRGFLFQSSEIYGGLNGFWDYGPLGVELKRNIKEAWWQDMISGHNELLISDGAPCEHQMVGIDCSIIMHPQVWKCSGHYDLFHDFMVDCKESKNAIGMIRCGVGGHLQKNKGYLLQRNQEGMKGFKKQNKKPLSFSTFAQNHWKKYLGMGPWFRL